MDQHIKRKKSVYLQENLKNKKYIHISFYEEKDLWKYGRHMKQPEW